MPIAFLRAINVGGHIVKMESLRGHFVEMGLRNVRTFIASGNVIFDSTAQAPALEAKIEKHLRGVLGYEVETFIRSVDEVTQAVADVEARLRVEIAGGAHVYVGFLRNLPSEAQQKQVLALSNEVDVFTFGRREVYWLCHLGMSQTTVTGPKLAKALGGPTTARNITSLRKLLLTFEK